MPLDERTTALLDILDRADEAQENLGYWFPNLEEILADDVMQRLRDALKSIEFIEQIATAQLGGPDQVVRLKFERETEEED